MYDIESVLYEVCFLSQTYQRPEGFSDQGDIGIVMVVHTDEQDILSLLLVLKSLRWQSIEAQVN